MKRKGIIIALLTVLVMSTSIAFFSYEIPTRDLSLQTLLKDEDLQVRLDGELGFEHDIRLNRQKDRAYNFVYLLMDFNEDFVESVSEFDTIVHLTISPKEEYKELFIDFVEVRDIPLPNAPYKGYMTMESRELRMNEEGNYESFTQIGDRTLKYFSNKIAIPIKMVLKDDVKISDFKYSEIEEIEFDYELEILNVQSSRVFEPFTIKGSVSLNGGDIYE